VRRRLRLDSRAALWRVQGGGGRHTDHCKRSAHLVYLHLQEGNLHCCSASTNNSVFTTGCESDLQSISHTYQCRASEVCRVCDDLLTGCTHLMLAPSRIGWGGLRVGGTVLQASTKRGQWCQSLLEASTSKSPGQCSSPALCWVCYPISLTS
jgi:hypothetical protein